MKTKGKTKKIVFLSLLVMFFCTGNIVAFDWETNKRPQITIKQTNNSIIAQSEKTLRPEREKVNALATLPSSYDLRDVNGNNYVTSVKMQNPWNNCWAFASLAAAETNALLKGASDADFSERALTWYTYQLQNKANIQSMEGISPSPISGKNVNLPFLIGGDLFSPIAQMASWNGASTEDEIPYENDEGIIESTDPLIYSPNGTWLLPYDDIFDNAYHLQNSSIIETYADYSVENVENYTEDVKQLIMEDGAVMANLSLLIDHSNFNQSSSSLYNPKPVTPDHAGAIVGWDDNYSIINFNSPNRPPANGAWIVKNSWGDQWGDDGYFYLSYYDQSILQFVSFDVETSELGYSYDNNLEYDFVGNKVNLSNAATDEISFAYNEAGGNSSDLRVANIYTLEESQTIDAFSVNTSFDVPSTVTTQIYLLNTNYANPQDGKLLLNQVNNIDGSGITTIDCTSPVIIEAGQSFSIVQNIVYSGIEDEEGRPVTLAGVPVEYGLSNPVTLEYPSLDTFEMIPYNLDIDTNVEPGESFIYGVNGTIGVTTPSWMDLADSNTQDELSVNVADFFQSDENVEATPGNVMIKVYTSDIDPNNVPATDIKINGGITGLYLATSQAGANAQTSARLNAVLTPENAADDITWMNSADSVARLSGVNGNSVTVTAVGIGKTIVTASSGSAVANLVITVTNDRTVCDSIQVTSDSPDYFTVLAKGVQPNPALNLNNSKIDHVTINTWSIEGQVDLNSKAAQRVPGTVGDWTWQGFSVNGNDYHTFYEQADNINIEVFASLDPNSMGNQISVAYYSWNTFVPREEANVCYIGYSQNIGFQHPTVYNGFPAGSTDSNLNLEGFRVSSNIPGVSVESQVHVQNLGWLDPVSDGSYVGTMHLNLGIEAIQLKLTGPNAQDYHITYRVLSKNGIWTPWVSNGVMSGTTGINQQIKAIEIVINQG